MYSVNCPSGPTRQPESSSSNEHCSRLQHTNDPSGKPGRPQPCIRTTFHISPFLHVKNLPSLPNLPICNAGEIEHEATRPRQTTLLQRHPLACLASGHAERSVSHLVLCYRCCCRVHSRSSPINPKIEILYIRLRSQMISFPAFVACFQMTCHLSLLLASSALPDVSQFPSPVILRLLIYDRLIRSLGASGLLVGGISGLIRSSTPGLFAVASGIQWFALGSTFWGICLKHFL